MLGALSGISLCRQESGAGCGTSTRALAQASVGQFQACLEVLPLFLALLGRQRRQVSATRAPSTADSGARRGFPHEVCADLRRECFHQRLDFVVACATPDG
ncbi:hypothetical protein [Nocardioides okcheonensis]|uniref:hypothetical protein n=1 Tax=Nocardioides okcheonensis TaxID=2894081 RepID=UPI001E551FDC|nr:hypothetical protein [Nocardioides okcheonensis]UFN45178.1 hypothetical protein LN652_02900 [Nocardioides okcheonensis]